MVSISDDGLLNEFVIESRDHLNAIEPDLLALEKQGADLEQEVINRIFRAIHSIKGAAGFFGLENLKNLSHIMENILMLIRDGKMVPSSTVVDPLLEGVDKLNQMLDDIGQSETIDCAALIAQLESVVSGKPPQASASDAPASSQTSTETSEPTSGLLNPNPVALEHAIAHGQSLYRVKAFLDKDFKDQNRTPLEFITLLDSIGTVMDSAMDVAEFPGLDGCLEASIAFVFLYTTVIENDLIAAALDVDPEQVEQLDAKTYLNGSAPDPKAIADTLASTVSESKEQPPAAKATQASEQTTVSEPKVAAPVQQAAPQVETKAASSAKPSSSSSSSEGMESVRVKVELLNKLMNLAGEMVLIRNQLIRRLNDEAQEIEGLPGILQGLNLTTSELQEHIMQTRMQPIGSVFGKFPRVVRDLSKSLNKQVELKMNGEEVELDKSLLESLSDPLTHLIRNSCDHGLELPDVRTANGKSPTGMIYLEAYQEGGQINIRISDDGKGIDAEKVAQKAISKGLITELDYSRMSDKERLNLIFLPGLSTAENVTDVSGRGVGMDVVRANITKLGGNISIDSEPGLGTTILLSLPLTLAIIPSLVVQSEACRFAIPQLNLEEIICVQSHEVVDRIEKIGTSHVLRLRGKLLPLVRLTDVLNIHRHYTDNSKNPPKREPERRVALADRRSENNKTEELLEAFFLEQRSGQRRLVPQDLYIIVLKCGTSQYGLIVDKVLNLEEIVVKPLSVYLKDCRAFSGSTIMGDGRVAMILDVNGIASMANLNFKDIQEHEDSAKQRLKRSNGNTTVMDIIMFSNNDQEIFAVPLESVQRLEKFETDKIEHIGANEYLSYRGKGMTLVRLEQVLPVNPAPMSAKEAYLILPKEGHGLVGVVASKIIDTDRVEVELQPTLAGYEGVLGSAVIHGHMVTFIEPNHLIRAMGLNNSASFEAFAGQPTAGVY